MDAKAFEFAARQQAYLEERQDQLVIDTDTHITDLETLSAPRRERVLASEDYFHGRPIDAELLVREMDMAEVDMALSWQNPASTAYTSDADHNYEALLAANRYVRDSARRYPQRIVPGGWTDPNACGVKNALRIVDFCIQEAGFLYVKMNPAQNHYPIDGPDVLAVLDRIVELGGIPVFHFGADTKFTPAEGMETIAKRHPSHPVLAVHMGGGGASYVEAENLSMRARRLGLEHPNLRFALSAKRDTHMESDLITYQLAGEPFCHNLFCASDAPYGRMAWNFGGFRAMLRSLMAGERHTDKRVRENPGLFTAKSAQDYLGGSFARFTVKGYARLLGVHSMALQS